MEKGGIVAIWFMWLWIAELGQESLVMGFYIGDIKTLLVKSVIPV
jgi:hypothetical protein